MVSPSDRGRRRAAARFRMSNADGLPVAGVEPLPPRKSLRARILAEVVRRHEERNGHPDDTMAADAAGQAVGGALAERVWARALALPDAPRILQAVHHQLRIGSGLFAALMLFAGIAGAGAVAGALGDRTVSLPLALVLIVGLNLFSLLAWLLLQFWAGALSSVLGTLLRRIWLAISRRHASAEPRQAAWNPLVLTTLLGGNAGRWLLSSAVHLAWLVFSLVALLGLTLLLSVKAYSLEWETTLLSPQALTRWAQLLSAGPELLGLPPPDPQAVLSGAHEAWARWLLAAVIAYGIVPRALALLVCCGLAGLSLHRLGRDMSQPGYARLRHRLMPDRALIGVVDPELPLPPVDFEDPGETAADPQANVVMLGLEYEPAGPWKPEPGLIWLGAVDDLASIEAMQQRLRDLPINRFVILLRSTATPDRGIERRIGQLSDAVQVTPVLLLGDDARLQARGAATHARRLEDWQRLASRIGAPSLRIWTHEPFGALKVLA